MRLDFWNNPIVVSALRVKYRRSLPFAGICLYILALLVGGSLLHQYHDRFSLSPYTWTRLYFLGLVSVQFLLSAAVALSATAASMNAEVQNRTLDFQRIASISPAEILLGKLLGEPATAYFMAIATIPLAVACWLAGATTLAVVALVYVNIATTTLMFGSLGLINRLEAPEKAASQQTGCSVGVFVIIVMTQVLVNVRHLLNTPWLEPAVGLLTPIPMLYGLMQGSAWERALPVFTLQVPYLLVTPLSQVAVSLVIFRIMTRRLVKPLQTSISKRFAYGVLVAVDLVMAAALYDPSPLAGGPVTLAAAFCLVHLLFSALLVLAITPWRESLLSWVWRFRGRRPRLVDLFLGERSENIVALLVFGMIGVAALFLLVVLPGAAVNPQAYASEMGSLAVVAGVTVLLLVSLGTLHQWFVLIMGRGGGIGFVLMVATLVLIPHLAGGYFEHEVLLAFSPSAHFARWLSGDPSLRLIPLIATYGALLLFARLALARRLRAHCARVDQKLDEMKRELPPADVS
jgi:hypothetical protein